MVDAAQESLSKPKLFYFDVYARAEPIRMALWKAKVDYEDVRLTGQAWKDVKNSDFLEFGQIPVYQLEDGTKLAQASAILNYIGAKYDLIPKDPLVAYNGDSFSEHTLRDFWQNQIRDAIKSSENRQENMEKAVSMYLGPWMDKLEKRLPADKKYLCGDQLTIYDFTVAGYFTNVICNPHAKEAPLWQQQYEEKAPARVKKYVQDFMEEMKEYLESRVQTCTM